MARRYACRHLPVPLLVLCVLLALPACRHNRPIAASTAARVERVAVVARLTSPPSVRVARGDREAAAAAFETGPAEVDGRLEAILAQALGPFELQEVVRSGFAAEIMEGPWDVASPLEVASALGTLLAVEDPPDWTKLVDLDIDAVFDVAVAGWGLRDEGPEHPVGGWMLLRARLIRPDTGAVLWSADVEANLSEEPTTEGGLGYAELAESPDWALRVAVAEAATEATRRLGAVLGARRLPKWRPPDAVD